MEDFTNRITDINRLNKLVRTMLELALADVKAKRVDVAVFETYRSQVRQNYLYCKGRTVKECTTAGIDSAFAKKYCTPQGGEVTWTLSSAHTLSKAVDLVPKINGKLTWSHTAEEQLIIINAMKKYGFECGANWENNPDSCHYQVRGNFSAIFREAHTNSFVTKVIQTALNSKLGAGLKVDGIWGPKTSAAVNKFRKSMKYKTAFGQIGAVAFRALMS